MSLGAARRARVSREVISARVERVTSKGTAQLSVFKFPRSEVQIRFPSFLGLRGPRSATLDDATMAITRSKGSRLEVDESIASLIVARLPDIRDKLALACVSKVWRLAAGSPGCWALHNDSLVVEGALAEKLPIDAAGAPPANTRVWQLMSYAGREIRVLEIHSSGLRSLTIWGGEDARYLVDGKVVKRPSYLNGIPSSIAIGYHLWTHLQVLDLRGCELLSVKCEVSYFLAKVTQIHTRPKEQRLDRLMLGGCDLGGLTESSLTGLWQCVRHEPDVEKSTQAPFDLCPCTGCRRVMSKGGQCKVCKHPYCLSCRYQSTVHELLCDFCDQDFLCGRSACLEGDIPFMYCDSCDLMFCEGCSQKDEVPYVLTCVGSDAREGCFMHMCEPCADKQDEVCFIGCDECEGFWCDSCDKAPEVYFCIGKGCTTVSCDDCGNFFFCSRCDEIRCRDCVIYCECCDSDYCHACDEKYHKCEEMYEWENTVGEYKLRTPEARRAVADGADSGW